MAVSRALLIERMKKGIRASQKRETKEVPVLYPSQGIAFPPGYPYPPPQKEEPSPERLVGIEISPTAQPRGKPLLAEKKLVGVTGTNIGYPLNPPYPKPGEAVLASAAIKWDQGELRYFVWEPPLTPQDKAMIDRIKRELEERLDIDFEKLGQIKAKEILRQHIQGVLEKLPDIPAQKRGTLLYYMERDFLGMGKIDTLMRDPNIEDISCDGVNIPIFIFHRDPKLGSMKTSLAFESDDELNAFVTILAQKANKSISIAEPLLDGALPDGSRIQATLGTDIARKGSNFTIRKFTDKPLTPTHMLRYKTADAMQLAYLWMAIDNGQTVLVSGGTATGKTSMLNAFSLFIRPGLKVVSIEDTPELRLPLPHWIPHVARSPLSIKGKVGEVTLFDLLKSSLRQRPDYIIVGEVRGEEAFVLFQQISTGHPSLATIHAASVPQLVDRLITPPISLPPSLIENLDIIVFLTLARIRGTYVRRANSIMEIVGIKDNRPETVNVFEWQPAEDKMAIKEKSVVLRKIANRLGLTEDTVKEEIVRRKRVLEWMLRQGIYDYREVARVISTYYSDPDRVMRAVDGAAARNRMGEPEVATPV
ncbi:MAG: type II/IV secretion system ATPase subunit [Candidatus Aenigmarchaeota archaeon]|nr:type II/IV secretion system ATPase subunit [Candidatus Aenigmarchaeota archaeon]